jgi:protein-tyrosine phosphatase
MSGERLPDDTEADAVLVGRGNLRDLGGLPTRGGRVVAPRRFFRSSAPVRFDVEQQRALTRMNLRSVIDLRSSAEVAQSGASVFSATIQVVHLPLFESARENWIAPTNQTPRATAERYFEMLNDGLGAVAAVVLRIAHPDTAPSLVSCSAGRDRTGIVVACVLDLLDVTEEAIATDYARSDSYDPGSGRAFFATIQELFALVRGHCGSTQQMLAPHGVTTSIRQSLRRELVVERQ